MAINLAVTMGSNTYNHYLENKAHNYFGDFTNLFFQV